MIFDFEVVVFFFNLRVFFLSCTFVDSVCALTAHFIKALGRSDSRDVNSQTILHPS